MATPKQEPVSDSVERIGAYRVVRRLATGGTSDVLLAKAEGPHGFERTVVLKVLVSTFGRDEEVARMFAREASAYARLSHPAIVRLFDFFAVPANGSEAPPVSTAKDRNGQLVMVLEYVDGPPLARLKSMVKAVGKELDDKAAIYVATCIFDALAAAHSAVDDGGLPAPVIHRDVNPSNVLIPWDGYPKLADFGVAKVTGLQHQSVAGMIKGTYGYMAPEQVTGGETVTPRSDVYAAAIILWELLTRRRAFQRGVLPEIEALRAMAEPRLPALESIRSDVDRTVREALRRALEPRADRRKITAEEMVSILTAVVPLEQGRERLTTLLGLVRNDARAANAQASIAPPAMVPTSAGSGPAPQVFIPGAPKTVDFGSMNGPPLVETTPSRLMSKISLPPRPSSQRMLPATPPSESSLADTAKLAPARIPGLDSNAPDPPTPRISSQNIPAAAQIVDGPNKPPLVPPPRISSQKMPAAAPLEPNVREMLSMPTRPMMPAVSGIHPLVGPPPPPVRPASIPQMPAVKAPPGASDAPRRPSASEQLAAAIPDEVVNTLESITPSRPMSILDSLNDSVPPPSIGRMSAPPDSPRTSKPLKDLTGGLGLRDAIDEIMRASSRGLPAAPLVEQPPPDEESGEPSGEKPLMRETTRVPADVAQALIGQIPPAPPPMTAPDLPTGEARTSPPPAANPPDASEGPPESGTRDEFPNAFDEANEPIDTVVQPEPLPPPTPRKLTPVMDDPRPSTPSMPANPATATGPMPKYQMPPPGFHAVPASMAPPAPVRSSLPPRSSRPSPSPSPATKSGVGVGTVALVLVVLIGAGIAGTIGYVRHQTHKSPDAGAPSARPIVAKPTPPVATSAAPSVTASVSAAPLVSAAAAPTASVSAAPVVSASAAPSEPIAEGMGLIRTANAAAGRRIFVDDKVVAQTPETVTVKCGAHVVKLGSSGKVQNVDVPCGGDVVVGDVKP